jgi:hypothetical protein
MVLKRPGAPLSQEVAAKVDIATRARIVNAVEPLYRVIFPRQDVLRFMVTPGRLHPHKVNETQGWMVECYDDAGSEIAHGLWDEQGRRHITISMNNYRYAPRTLPLLSPEAAARIAREWLYRTRMAVPLDTEDRAHTVKLSGDVWHIPVPLSDGVVMVWMNARTGEVHQATRVDQKANCGAAGFCVK